MRNMILAAAGAALFGMGSASAADLYGGMKDTVAYEPAGGWGGAYAGISGGIAVLSEKFYDSEGDGCRYTGICPDGQGIGGLIGGTFGYNWQIRNLVLGVEGDISWADLGAKVTPASERFVWSHIDTIATARLRTGYAIGANLFYLTGGAAFLETQHKAIDGDPCNTGHSTCEGGRWRTGFAVGAGYEAALSSKLSLKAEYLYIGDPTYAMTNHLAIDNQYGFIDDVQVFRVGVNYKLTGGVLAADLRGGTKDTVAYEPAGVWSGAYVGISGGAALLSERQYASDGAGCVAYGICPDGQGYGGLVGGTLGYNWQIRNLVFGAEGDFSWADLTARISPDSNRTVWSHIDAIATARLRMGYALGDNLFYLTGGAAFLEAQRQAIARDPCNTGFSTCEGDRWRPGFTAGAGYEAALYNNLNWKAEYLYIGDPTYSMTSHYAPGEQYGFIDDVHVFRVGLNYKFGGGIAGYAPLK